MHRLLAWSSVSWLMIALAGCGEHPCTLGVGEPTFCTANPEELTNPFCGELCDVCDYDRQTRMQAACEAHCREHVGIPEYTCEEIDPMVEIEYRECVRTSDFPGCGDENAVPRHLEEGEPG